MKSISNQHFLFHPIIIILIIDKWERGGKKKKKKKLISLNLFSNYSISPNFYFMFKFNSFNHYNITITRNYILLDYYFISSLKNQFP